MEKTYMARTSLSISVKTPKGKSRYVAFKVQTNGTSLFRTDDTDLQQGLESHYKFKKTFWEVEVEKSKITSDAVIDENSAEQKSGLLKITVTDIGDAREKIAIKTGISRSKLRKKEEIEAAAKANNIMLIGLD